MGALRKTGERTTLQQTGPRLAAVGDRATLVVYHKEGAKIALLARGTPLVIGRAWPADVVVGDPGLSRRHAQFTWEEGGVYVEDLGSTNGTKLNGTRIKKRERFKAGDEVSMGGVLVVLQQLEEKDEQLRGIDGHDKFVNALDEEVARSRTFTRPCALLMVTAEDRDVHIGRIVPRVRPHLRPVDRLGLYAPGCLLLLLPESDRGRAEAVAHALGGREKPAVGVGIAVYPEDAASAEELLSAVRQAARSGGAPRARDEASKVVVASPSMKAVFQTVDRVARSPIPVLLLGETGVGKEVVARAIHEGGPRKGKPLKSINCAAIPHTLIESVLFGHEKGAFTGAERQQKGIFEQAHGGTVLLDEVGELPPPAQAALLRVLETKRLTRIGGDQEIEVDVRVIAATHRDLEAMCKAGAFRWDLLYRLNTMPILIPPLRERREEVEPLAELFLREARKASGAAVRAIDRAALATLTRYGWPGNVRELKNVIERAVVVAEGDSVQVDDLPQRVRGTEEMPPEAQRTGDRNVLDDGDYKERVRRYEIDLIVQALTRAGGNQTEAARLLKMPLRTLVHKIQTYGIKKKFEVSK